MLKTSTEKCWPYPPPKTTPKESFSELYSTGERWAVVSWKYTPISNFSYIYNWTDWKMVWAASSQL